MTDGISEARRSRSIEDIAETGASYITEKELEDLISQVKLFKGLWFRTRNSLVILQNSLQSTNPKLASELDKIIWSKDT